MNLDLKDLQFYILPGNPSSSFKNTDIYEKTYQTWRQVWEETFLELDGKSDLSSDGFTRQTFIGSIFLHNRCVALSSIRECDFRFKSNNEDSLLSSWDEESFQILLEKGTRVGICSYLTVHQEYRGQLSENLSLKSVIAHMSAKMFLNSNCDVMTGTARCNRGTHRASYDAGARFIKQSKMHGIDVDLIGFFRDELLNNPTLNNNIWAEYLWKNRIDLTNAADTNSDLKTHPQGKYYETY